MISKHLRKLIKARVNMASMVRAGLSYPLRRVCMHLKRMLRVMGCLELGVKGVFFGFLGGA